MSQKIFKQTKGVLTTEMDFVLFQLFFGEGLTLPPPLAHRLRKKGLIRDGKLTSKGRERLKAKLPRYKKERPWEGRVFLIIYDVPEVRRSDRELLRRLLKDLNCAQLQSSVYLSVYNVKAEVLKFAQGRGLQEFVLVSQVIKESLGRESLPHLLNRLYHLDELNQRYFQFAKGGEKTKPRWKAALDFLSIVKDDPQLPFELLPQPWWGQEAYKVYSALVTK